MLLCGQERSSILSRESSATIGSHESFGAQEWHDTDARTPAFRGASPVAKQASRGALPSARWDPDVAFELCAEGQEAEYDGRVQFLDKAVVKSVRAAAQGLNEGHIRCRDGVCAAFSEERRQWYVLHATGSKEAALACVGRAVCHASPAEPLRTPRMTPSRMALARMSAPAALCAESRRPSPGPREGAVSGAPAPRVRVTAPVALSRAVSSAATLLSACTVSARGPSPDRGSQWPCVPLLDVPASPPRLPETHVATPPCLARQATLTPRTHEPTTPSSPPVDETFSARYQLPQDSSATGFDSPRRSLVLGGRAGASMPQLGKPVQEQSSSASAWLERERTVADAMIEHRRIALEQRQALREQEEDKEQQQQQLQQQQHQQQQQQQQQQPSDVLHHHLQQGSQRSKSLPPQPHRRQNLQQPELHAHELQLQWQAPCAPPQAADLEGALAPRAPPGAEPPGAAGAGPADVRLGSDLGDFPVVYRPAGARAAARGKPAAGQGLEEASPEEARLRAELHEAQERAQAMREEAAWAAEENAAVRQQLQEALLASQEAPSLRERLEQLGPKVREASELRRQLESATQALQEGREARAKLAAAEALAQEVVVLRQALDTAQAAAREVEGLRQQLREEKRDFCQHLEQIESVVASLSVRERDLAAQVAELTAENQALAARLVQEKGCQGHSGGESVSTHCGGRASSSTASSSDGCSGVVSLGSKEERQARDLLKEEVSQKDGAMVLLQSRADMAQRKLKLADMENAMLKRQLLALRKLRPDGDDS